MSTVYFVNSRTLEVKTEEEMRQLFPRAMRNETPLPLNWQNRAESSDQVRILKERFRSIRGEE